MNKYHLLIISIGFISIATSCANNNAYNNSTSISLSDFNEVVSLHGTVIEFDDLLMRPVDLHIIDSFLIMKNHGTEYHFHVFNHHNNKKVGELVEFGNGPQDMISPTIISSDDSFLWITDKQKRSIAKCMFYSSGDTTYLSILNKINVEEYLDKAAILPNGGILSVAINPQTEARFHLLDSTGQTINTVGEYPDCGIDFTMIEKIEAFFCDFAINYPKQRIFMSYKQTDLIEIYDLEGRLIKRMHGPDHFTPFVKQVNVGDRSMVRTQSGKARDAYFVPQCVGDEFFVIYSGKVYDREVPSYLSDKIFVFDHEGNPKRIYELDMPFYSFAVDPVNRVIYGLSDDPEFHAINYHY